MRGLPASRIEKQMSLAFMWKTKNGDKDYKHIVIYQNEKSFFLRTNIEDKEHYDDLMPYKI